MNLLLIFILAAFVVAIALNGLQPPDEPRIMYVPIEVPASHGNGCFPQLLAIAAIIIGIILVIR